jgi:hypothetical protein
MEGVRRSHQSANQDVAWEVKKQYRADAGRQFMQSRIEPLCLTDVARKAIEDHASPRFRLASDP